MSARNTASLHGFYAGAPREMRRISPADAGLRRIGHFGFFRRASAGTLWPRLVSALYRPEAVVAQGDNVTVVTRGTGERLAVTLAPFAEGLRLTGVTPYDAQALSDAALLDGAFPDDGED